MNDQVQTHTVNAGPADTLDLDNLFSYHPPAGPDQVAQYQRIREAGRQLALVLAAEVPASPERSLAISRVREAVMWANAGIACNAQQPPPSAPPAAIPRPDRTPGPDVP